MKNLAIAPHYFSTSQKSYAAISTFLTDYLIEKNFLPLPAIFDTKIITLDQAKSLGKEYISQSDGLILQGGDDVAKSLYHPESLDQITFRDHFEVALVKESLNQSKPIFGICRGMQIINVIFGGTLKDLAKGEINHVNFHTDKPAIVDLDNVDLTKKHLVTIKPNSVLSFLPFKEIKVNSVHRQGVDKLGKTLNIEANSPDGLIEAISNKTKKILALQWHPELDLENEVNSKILDFWLKWV